MDIVCCVMQAQQHREVSTDHLGHVRATVSDMLIPRGSGVFDADLRTLTDYYPFGMTMPERSYAAAGIAGHRYGYNGKENDNEVKGEGNQQDYGARIYDPRVARFLSVDPLARAFAAWSSYHFSANSPILVKDADGRDWVVVPLTSHYGRSAAVTLATFHEVVGLLFNNKIIANIDERNRVSIAFAPGASEGDLNSSERVLFETMQRAIVSPADVQHNIVSDNGDITVGSFTRDPNVLNSPGMIDVGDVKSIAKNENGR